VVEMNLARISAYPHHKDFSSGVLAATGLSALDPHA